VTPTGLVVFLITVEQKTMRNPHPTQKKEPRLRMTFRKRLGPRTGGLCAVTLSVLWQEEELLALDHWLPRAPGFILVLDLDAASWFFSKFKPGLWFMLIIPVSQEVEG
jgi:hypothetical protein